MDHSLIEKNKNKIHIICFSVNILDSCFIFVFRFILLSKHTHIHLCPTFTEHRNTFAMTATTTTVDHFFYEITKVNSHQSLSLLRHSFLYCDIFPSLKMKHCTVQHLTFWMLMIMIIIGSTRIQVKNRTKFSENTVKILILIRSILVSMMKR